MHPLFTPDRLVQVILGTSLAAEEVSSMLSLIHEFADVFEWSHDDMLGVLPELAEHRLCV